MGSNRDIRDILQGIMGTNTMKLFDMEVVSVSEQDRTATCTNGTNEIICRLMASVDDGMLCIPEVGSTVIVMLSTTVEPVIIMYSGIDKIVMRGGQFDGVPKAPTLKDKLNNLENKVNDLINTFNSHVHPGVTSGPSSTATTVTPVSGTLTPTTQAEIENNKVTHG